MRTSTTFQKGHIGYKAWLGKPRSEETKRKISEKLKGRPIALKNGKLIRAKGEQNNKWLGDEVGYSGIHKWLTKSYGSPKICDNCDTEDAKRYEWALLKGKSYERNRDNFIRMCKKCHNNYDGNSIELQNKK